MSLTFSVVNHILLIDKIDGGEPKTNRSLTKSILVSRNNQKSNNKTENFKQEKLSGPTKFDFCQETKPRCQYFILAEHLEALEFLFAPLHFIRSGKKIFLIPSVKYF